MDYGSHISWRVTRAQTSVSMGSADVVAVGCSSLTVIDCESTCSELESAVTEAEGRRKRFNPLVAKPVFEI